MKSKIIILNGTSSSGKTAILKDFQELYKGCYYGIRMDRINDILPKKYLIYDNYENLTEENKKGFYFDKEEKMHKIGEYGKNMTKDFWHIVKSLAEQNRNIIIDIVMFGLNDLKNVIQILDINKYDTYIVRVSCCPKELCKREKNRGDRPVGSAEKQISLIDIKYNDLVLDSTEKGSKQLAKELLDFIKTNKPKMLFKLLKNTK